MDKNLKTNILKIIIIVFLIISICLTIASQFMPWANIYFETKNEGAKLNKVSLEADIYESKIDYKVFTNQTKGGIGGIGGGIISSPGSSSDKPEYKFNYTNESKVFLTGLGGFQKDIGEVLDSWVDREYTIKALIWNTEAGKNDYTNITVKSEVDLIPWWPVDIAQKCKITVAIDSTNNLTQRIEVDRIWIELWTDWDDEEIDYTKSKVIWEKKSNDKLYNEGDKKTYTADISIDKNYGKVGLAARVEISVIDMDGNTTKKIISPFTSESHPTTINIYTMEKSEYYNIIFMVLAFPFTIVSLILIGIALPLTFIRSRAGTILILIAAILGILAITFYINGVNTLVSLLDSVLAADVKEGLSFDQTALLIPSIAVVLSFISFGLAFINQRPKIKAKPGENVKVVEWKKGSKDKKQKLVFKPITGGTDTEVEPLVDKKIRPRKGKRKKKRQNLN